VGYAQHWKHALSWRRTAGACLALE
jgi:hypothetical protein